MKRLYIQEQFNGGNLQFDSNHVMYRDMYPFRMYSTGEMIVHSQPKIDDRHYYPEFDITLAASTTINMRFATPEGEDILPAWFTALDLQTLLIDHTHKIAVCSEVLWNDPLRPSHLTRHGAYYSNVFNGQPKPVGSKQVYVSPPHRLTKEEREWKREVLEAAKALDELEDPYVSGWQRNQGFNPVTTQFDIAKLITSGKLPDPHVYTGSLSRYDLACVAKKGFQDVRKLYELDYVVLK